MYVAFHLQPENTTNSFGLNYMNQLLFLRKVRSIVPPQMTIVVKDHPCNSTAYTYPRPVNYMGYVKAIVPGVVCEFYPAFQEFDSDAICTFSINGTCCLESAILGKPAIFGGRSFFASLPNISQIDCFQNCDDFENWLEIASAYAPLDSRLKNFFSIFELSA